ncbi:hypothetical protein [Streptomyces coelicoflavus]|uniref:hypothetical protein n=1 Tax=Streptomyces coelicoflavus TaxID=285562 RepID=UPI002E25F3E2
MRSPRTKTGGRHRSRTSTAFLLTAALGTALLAGAPAALAAEPDTDLTGNGGVLTAQDPETGDESEHKLIDNDVTTKYFTPRSTACGCSTGRRPRPSSTTTP